MALLAALCRALTEEAIVFVHRGQVRHLFVEP
jgi:hypothetical protein